MNKIINQNIGMAKKLNKFGATIKLFNSNWSQTLRLNHRPKNLGAG
jgi:hypothetical protein